MIEIETSLAPRPLKFEVLRRIESDLGRRRSQDKYAPRTIDLDILAYDQLAVTEDDIAGVFRRSLVYRRNFFCHPVPGLPQLSTPPIQPDG